MLLETKARRIGMNFDSGRLEETADVWAPDFPRRASASGAYQTEVNSRDELCDSLASAARNGMPGFVSVYSFPRGHSKEGKIPRVDTIFVDFDIQGERYHPDDGEDDFDDWRIEMSDLLVRVRSLARILLEEGEAEPWRASLSGHKGIHLFLDFPPVEPQTASFLRFKQGLNSYAETVIESLDDEAGGIGLEDWVDVNSSDLGRLTRMPNTPHHGVAYTDETRYCVPVSIEELAEMDVERYVELTSSTRPIPESCERRPDEDVGSKVTQHIVSSESPTSSLDSPASNYDSERVEKYREESNDNIELEDLNIILRDKPFVIEFRNRDDAYEHGTESRYIEIFAMLELIHNDVPIDIIVEFFSPIPRFDSRYTREMVKDLISRQFNRMSIETIEQEAPTFFHSEKYD